MVERCASLSNLGGSAYDSSCHSSYRRIVSRSVVGMLARRRVPELVLAFRRGAETARFVRATRQNSQEILARVRLSLVPPSAIQPPGSLEKRSFRTRFTSAEIPGNTLRLQREKGGGIASAAKGR